MALLEVVAVKLAETLVKFAVAAGTDSKVAGELGASATGALGGQAVGWVDRQRARRGIDQFVDRLVADDVDRYGHEFRRLSDSDRAAAAQAVVDTFDAVKAVPELVASSDLDPGRLADTLRRRSVDLVRRAALGRDGEEFYDRLLHDACVEIVKVASHRPEFQAAVQAETLGRLTALGGDTQAGFAHISALLNQLGARRPPLDAGPADVPGVPRQLRAASGKPITSEYFTGKWRSLLPGYLDPTVDRVAVMGGSFVERAWLVGEIDAFMGDHDRGYFIVEADAGMGKTAFALWYSGLDRRPIHFAAYSAGARDTGSAVRNLGAQLIVLCGLDEREVAWHPAAGTDWSSWMRQVLIAAANLGQPIVLVVDGLDEATEQDVDHLPFGLPDELPSGVYVVATVRTGGLVHQPTSQMVVCNWNRRAVQQQEDLRVFITTSVQSRFASVLREDGLTQSEFVTLLLDKCGGVWLYASHVLEEIASGARRPRDVPLLPAGLTAYYHNTVERFLQLDADANWRLPLLATLAIAVEPLAAETLIVFGGLDDHPRVRPFLDGPLRPFCTVTDAETPHRPDRYKLKHPSFGEYLVAGPGPDDTVERVRQRRKQLAEECRAAGQRVCDRYLTAWGGLDAGLPALAADPSLAQRDSGYSLRGLAIHLFATGRDDDLHKLLAAGQQRNVWYAAHESAGETQSFLNDVATARRALDRAASAQPPSRSDDIDRKIRYALVESSVATAFTNITPELLGILVERGHWSPTRALGTIERMTDGHQQARALLRILDSIPDALIPDAWPIARAVQAREYSCRAVAALIPRLPDDLLDDAVDAVAERTGKPGVLTAAVALVDQLPEQWLDHNFPWYAMSTMTYKEKMVITSVVALKRGSAGAGDRTLASLVEEVDHEITRCQYLTAIIPQLPATAFDGAIALLSNCRARYRGDALIALARHAPLNQVTDLLNLADVAWAGTPTETEARPLQCMMRVLGKRVAGTDRISGVLAFTRELPVEWAAEAIEELAPYLSDMLARQELRAIEADSTRWWHGDNARWLMIAVGALARRLPPSEAAAVVQQYVQKYCKVDDDLRIALQSRDEELTIAQAERLAPVAAFLPRDTVRLTLRSICRGISLTASFAESLTPALSRMIPTVRADPTLLHDAFSMMLDPGAWRPASRLLVLSVLAPQLDDDDALNEAINLVLPGPIEVECFAAIAALGRELPKDQRETVARRALHAALDINNDRQRTLAVAALAPTLTAKPAKQALDFVGSVTHSVLWPSVFRALDSLAPHLPATALPRALQIVMDVPTIQGSELQHLTRLFERLGRDDEIAAIRNYFQFQGSESHPWDSWLWALAPFLPARLAEEALAVASTLPTDSARRTSMAALAPRLPDRLRAAVAHDVLELLHVAPDDMSIQIAVVARLAAATETDEVSAACQRLLTTMRPDDLNPSNHSWDAYRDLLTHLPRDLVDIALRFSTQLIPVERYRVIRALAPRVPDHLMADLIASLEAADVETDAELKEQGHALIALATHTLKEDEKHRIVTAVFDRMVQRRWWWVSGPSFIELIPLLPQPRDQAVAAAVRQCFDTHQPEGLEPLLDLLDGTELESAFREAGQIHDPHERVHTTAAVLLRAGTVGDRSTVFPNVDLLGAWPPTNTRAELFTLIGASAWWIHQHGGNHAVAATIDAAFDVSRWWR